MKFQRHRDSCGCAVVVNALRVFDVRVNEYKVWGLANFTKCTPDIPCAKDHVCGTQEDGMINAIRELGFAAAPYSTDNSENAWTWLHGKLLHGFAVILCVQAFEHWVVCDGTLGDKVHITDSSNFKYNKAENGSHHYSKSKLLRQWKNGRKSNDESKFYAIAVSKK